MFHRKWLFSMALMATMALGTVQARRPPPSKFQEALEKYKQARKKLDQAVKEVKHAQRMYHHYLIKRIKIFGHSIPDPRAAPQIVKWRARYIAAQAAYRVAYATAKAAYEVYRNLKP